jgi:hypothetical protein
MQSETNDRLAALEAEVAALRRERDEWKDVADKWTANYKSAVHHMGAEADNSNRRIAELEAALAAERDALRARILELEVQISTPEVEDD